MALVSREMWRGLFDDAAVFPPGLASLPAAVARHLRRRRGPATDLVGPLLLPMADVRAAASLIPPGEEPVAVGMIVTDGALALAAHIAEGVGPAVAVAGFEFRPPAAASAALDDAARLVDPALLTVELSSDQVRDGAAELLAARGIRMKFRTGGMRAEAFPSARDLAHVIHAAVEQGVAFKLTAGLHEPLRHDDPQTGFRHHGFLNVAAATGAARRGEGQESIEALLACDDASVLVSALGDGSWRSAFSSFGTCSIAEPVRGLAALGLIDAATAATVEEDE